MQRQLVERLKHNATARQQLVLLCAVLDVRGQLGERLEIARAHPARLVLQAGDKHLFKVVLDCRAVGEHQRRRRAVARSRFRLCLALASALARRRRVQRRENEQRRIGLVLVAVLLYTSPVNLDT